MGCLAPDALRRQLAELRKIAPRVELEIHAHNDYGLATANTLAAVAQGVRAVHVTVNGLGERAGNASRAEVVAALHDHARVRTGVVEARLGEVAQLVERLSDKRLAANASVTGRDVFTQTAGIHADGDRKAALYASRLAPERFGRSRGYALGKLAGRASLDQNLDQLGLQLTANERDRVLLRIVELGDQKHVVRAADLPQLIREVLGPDAAATAARPKPA